MELLKLNLAAFSYSPQAAPTNGTYSNTVGVNDLTPEMKTFYETELLDEAGPNLVHGQFGEKHPIPQGRGKTIEFRKFDPLPKATTPLTEGVTPDGSPVNVTSITATVEQYGDFIPYTDMLDMTAIDPFVAESTKLLGRQAGLTIDSVDRDALMTGTNVSFASKWSGSTETEVTTRAAMDNTSVLKVDTVLQAVAKLQAQNTPTIDGDYVAIIHPYAAYDLKRDPEWIDAHKYAAPENLFNGEIGKIGGVRFVQSTEAKIFKGADLAPNSRTLTANANASGAITSLNVTGGTLTSDSLKGRNVIINGIQVEVTGNTATAISFASTNFGTITSGTTKIYPGDGDSDGGAVFATLVLGKGAYGTTEITGGGLEMFVKQLGSSGSADPLDQRATVGWKTTHVTELLLPQYMVRIESVSPRYSASAKAN